MDKNIKETQNEQKDEFNYKSLITRVDNRTKTKVRIN